MPPPRTYGEWLPILDKFRSGDDACLSEMWDGSIEWTNVVAERWTRQVAACLNDRLTALSKEFQHALDRSNDNFAIGRAMIFARRRLVILRAFASLPALPVDVRGHLEAQVDGWATQTQQSLERHAGLARHDQGLRLKTIRDHSLTVRSQESSRNESDIREDSVEVPTTLRGRRILL
jgi:hypothetical protein